MSSKITEELRDSLVRCARAGLLNTVSYAALNAIADRIDAEHERCKEESAKLRELCADMLHDAMENCCSKAYWCAKKNWQECDDESCGNRLYVKLARELGVES